MQCCQVFTMKMKVPLTHLPCHQPTESVMRSVADGRCGRGSIESTCVNCRDSWLWVGSVMSIVEHNYVITDGDGERGNEIKGCS